MNLLCTLLVIASQTYSVPQFWDIFVLSGPYICIILFSVILKLTHSYKYQKNLAWIPLSCKPVLMVWFKDITCFSTIAFTVTNNSLISFQIINTWKYICLWEWNIPSCPNKYRSVQMKCSIFFFFLLSTFLRNCFLCWDHRHCDVPL